jgi:hypothetical protein
MIKHAAIAALVPAVRLHQWRDREASVTLARLLCPGVLTLTLCGEVRAQGAAAPPPAGDSATLFRNVRIFDGKSGTLTAPSNVLVNGNVIARISTADFSVDPKLSVTVVAGGGRVLMPGLIDAHWHSIWLHPGC